MSGQDDRKDFKKWQVDVVFNEVQQGQCANCGAGLEQTGFHRDHVDGDHSNNETDNLQLLCPKCHWAKAGEGKNPYTEHQEQEKRVLTKLNELIEQALDPSSKVSGAAMEKMVDAMSMSLKVSRNVTDVDYGREHTPASVKMQRRMAEQEIQLQSFMDGVMFGVKKALDFETSQRVEEE